MPATATCPPMPPLRRAPLPPHPVRLRALLVAGVWRVRQPTLQSSRTNGHVHSQRSRTAPNALTCAPAASFSRIILMDDEAYYTHTHAHTHSAPRTCPRPLTRRTHVCRGRRWRTLECQ